MSEIIRRETDFTPNDITITSTESTSGWMPSGCFAGAVLYCVSTSTAGAITISWRAQYFGNSPLYKLHDATNAAITTVIQAGRCYEIPAELFASFTIRAVADTAGQSAVVRLSYKS